MTTLKPQTKQIEVLELYKNYCDYIDADTTLVSEHDYYKGSLTWFMRFLEVGYIDDIEDKIGIN